MKIAFISPFAGEAYGTERVISLSAQLLTDAGHEVIKIFGERRGKLSGVTREHPIPGLSHISWRSPASERKQTLVQLESVLNETKPDAVVLCDAFPPSVTRKVSRSFPTIFIAHSVGVTCPASHRLKKSRTQCIRRSGWGCLASDMRDSCLEYRNLAVKVSIVLNHQLQRRGLKLVHRICTVSQSLRQVFVEDGWDEARIDVVPNPVVVPSPVSLPDAPSSLILTTSRLVSLKGLDVLLRALAQIKTETFSLWIVGDGIERKNLERLASDLGLSDRVKFQGRLSQAETESAVAASFLVIQPNLAPEAFGLGVAEAMFLGKAVIASDIPALNELIEHGKTGILVPPGDVERLAQEIKRLLGDPQLCAQLGERARTSVMTKYSQATHCQALIDSIRAAQAQFAASN